MKDRFCETVEKGRCGDDGFMERHQRGDRFGTFLIAPSRWTNDRLLIIASDGTGWAESSFPLPVFEHVSVSVLSAGIPAGRCPTWEEMDYVKTLFWGPEETVLQYHPPLTKKVNHHPHCLHLFKPIGVEIPVPPPGAI